MSTLFDFEELPAMRAAREARSLHRVTYDGQDRSLVRVPPEAVSRLVQRLANSVRSSIRQIIPTPPSAKNPSGGFFDVVLRAVADDDGRDVSVDRLYVVPPGGRDLLEAEPSQGPRFHTRRVTVQEALPEFIDYPTTSAWLIDETVVIREGTAKNPSWTVSSHTTDVDQFDTAWNRLLRQASEDTASGPRFELSPSLVRSADRVANVAEMTCDQHLFGAESCDWYHGAWQYLRLCDLVCAPSWHHSFYSEELRRVLTQAAQTETDPDRTAQVLISGASDHSMLAYVYDAVEQAGVKAAVAMLDICRTPLLATRWFAKHREPRIEPDLYQLDARRAAEELGSDRFDLVVTDNLLNSLPSNEDCEEVLRDWSALLRPGGVALTTVRIYPDAGSLSEILASASEFVLQARARAAQWQPYIDRPLDEVTAMARKYAASAWSRDLGDRAAVETMFAKCGFDVEYARIDDRPEGWGPARYLSIVARKRSTTDR